MAKLSLRLAAKYLPPCSSDKRWRTFTQPQLMTCLIRRPHLKAAYRKFLESSETGSELCARQASSTSAQRPSPRNRCFACLADGWTSFDFETIVEFGFLGGQISLADSIKAQILRI